MKVTPLDLRQTAVPDGHARLRPRRSRSVSRRGGRRLRERAARERSAAAGARQGRGACSTSIAARKRTSRNTLITAQKLADEIKRERAAGSARASSARPRAAPTAAAEVPVARRRSAARDRRPAHEAARGRDEPRGHHRARSTTRWRSCASRTARQRDEKILLHRPRQAEVAATAVATTASESFPNRKPRRRLTDGRRRSERMIADGPGGASSTSASFRAPARTELAGTRDGALLVRLAAPPVDGAANVEFLAFLARHARRAQVAARRSISGERAAQSV